MRKLYYISLLFSVFMQGQNNLVRNPGFESYYICPSYVGLINYATPWFKPSDGSSDYFNSCAPGSGLNVPNTYAGFSYARDGNGMAGILLVGNMFYPANRLYREYVGVRLTQTLSANQRYFISFYVKLADSSFFASSSIGMLFAKDSIWHPGYDSIVANTVVNNPLGNFITNKTSWKQIKGSFNAIGTEKFVYIGNFNAFLNDTLRVMTIPPDYNIQSDCFYPYYFIDDVCLSTSENYCDLWTGIGERIADQTIGIFPNPVKDKLHFEFDYAFQAGATINIHSVFGELVYSDADIDLGKEIDLAFLKPGVYYVNLKSGSGQQKFKMLKE